MKHTPAPWNYHPVPSDSFDGKTSYWIDLSNGAPIADVRTRPDEEHAANARLIAAAPELLEALSVSAELIRLVIAAGFDVQLESQYTPKGDTKAVLTLADAAIAKAKG